MSSVNEYQNTKLTFTFQQPTPPSHPWLPDNSVLCIPYMEMPAHDWSHPLTITIDEGSYTPNHLATEIGVKMNLAVQLAWGPGPSSATHCINTYLNPGFVCKYNVVSNTFWFGNLFTSFKLLFGTKEAYHDLCPGQITVWNHATRWGLPAYLGYKKFTYTAEPAPALPGSGANNGLGNLPVPGDLPGFSFAYEYPIAWLTPLLGSAWPYAPFPQTSGASPQLSGLAPHIVNINDLSGNLAICNLDVLGEDVIYMEMDRYNSINELEPYVDNTSGWFNNDYNGKVNSAFAKIPIACTPFSQVFDSRNAFLMNVSHYNPPIERIRKLRFKFRYHDGRLVDFRCLPFNFSLEFNMLKDEQIRAALVRVPPLYRL